VATGLPKYQITVEEKIDTLRGATVKRLSNFTTKLRGGLNVTFQSTTHRSGGQAKQIETADAETILSRWQ
jgi:hypothetical protein